MATTSPAPRKQPWQSIAAAAQSHRDSTLAAISPALPRLPPQEELPLNTLAIPASVLSREEDRITTLRPEELLPQLASGTLSAVEVTNAFLRRAGVCQGLTNCVTELLPSRALARAVFLDDYLATHGRPIGALHGLPISVKEHIGLKDLRLTASFVSLYDNIATEDAHCLRILEAAGAVFHARTTQPQTVMHLETESNLYGVTVNPYNRELTAGGSSGGEGALVAGRGSCLGIGTDVGGSVRSPAANCGVYGLRPTSGRVPVGGWLSALPGTDNIMPVIGPLSNSLEGIKLFMQVLIDAKPWLVEPSLLPIPWRRELTAQLSVNKLKVAVMWDDEVVRPHPPVTRALEELVTKLRIVPEVEIVNWKPYKHDEAWKIAASLYFIDGGKEEEDLIADSNEPWLPLSRHIIRENEYCKRLSIEELWLWQNKREVYREEYSRIWNETAIGPDGEDTVDIILCPVGPGAAPIHGTAKWWGYTSQWNVLDYPAVVFPVTKCDAKLDVENASYRPRNDKDEFNWKSYNSTKYDGVPVSLQLVGRRYEDEKLLGVLTYIEEVVGLPFTEFP